MTIVEHARGAQMVSKKIRTPNKDPLRAACVELVCPSHGKNGNEISLNLALGEEKKSLFTGSCSEGSSRALSRGTLVICKRSKTSYQKEFSPRDGPSLKTSPASGVASPKLQFWSYGSEAPGRTLRPEGAQLFLVRVFFCSRNGFFFPLVRVGILGRLP